MDPERSPTRPDLGVFRERKDCLRRNASTWTVVSGRSGGLDGAAFVHGPVALGGLAERQGSGEDLSGLDFAVADQVDELGQEAAYRGGPAADADVGVQQLLAGQ